MGGAYPSRAYRVTRVHGLVGLLLVSVSVGLGNFAGAIGIGLSGINARTRLRVGIAFGLFEGIMPLVGLLVGHAIAGQLGHYAKYIGAVLLVMTGVYTIWQGRRAQKDEAGPKALRTHHLWVTAFALSIDNLAVGFALGVYQIQIVLAALTMGVVSVAMSLVGLELGGRLGSRVEAVSEELGGAVLIGVGILLATGLLG